MFYEKLFKSSGILRYHNEPVLKLVLDIDQEISEYYRSLIPKWFEKPSKQMYMAHISVIRNETPVKMENWGKYEGKEIEFCYSNVIQFGEVYCWLNCFSTELEKIRLELGLKVDSPYTKPPDGLEKTFHTTIGNFKHLRDL